MLNRHDFIQLCKDAIIETRDCVVPANQLDGYLTYHNELKTNDYMHHFRQDVKKEKGDANIYFFKRHEMIKQAGMGYCNEFANFLLVEIALRLQQKNIQARLRKVESINTDHAYVHVRIELENEHASLWEIDAWDPRIIDATKTPDGTIKNEDYLVYGKKIQIKESVWSDEIKPITFTSEIRQPQPGSPLFDSTPPHDVYKKNSHIYANYTMDRAYKNQNLPLENEPTFLQRSSLWQLKF